MDKILHLSSKQWCILKKITNHKALTPKESTAGYASTKLFDHLQASLHNLATSKKLPPALFHARDHSNGTVHPTKRSSRQKMCYFVRQDSTRRWVVSITKKNGNDAILQPHQRNRALPIQNSFGVGRVLQPAAYQILTQ